MYKVLECQEFSILQDFLCAFNMAKHASNIEETDWLSKNKGIVTYSPQEVLSQVQCIQVIVAAYKFEGEHLDYLIAKMSDLKTDVVSHMEDLKHYIEDQNVPFCQK